MEKSSWTEFQGRLEIATSTSTQVDEETFRLSPGSKKGADFMAIKIWQGWCPGEFLWDDAMFTRFLKDWVMAVLHGIINGKPWALHGFTGDDGWCHLRPAGKLVPMDEFRFFGTRPPGCFAPVLVVDLTMTGPCFPWIGGWMSGVHPKGRAFRFVMGVPPLIFGILQYKHV